MIPRGKKINLLISTVDWGKSDGYENEAGNCMGNPGAILPLQGDFSKALKAQGETAVCGRCGDRGAGGGTTEQSPHWHALLTRGWSGVCVVGVG